VEFEFCKHLIDTSSRQPNVLGEVLTAGYDARLTIGRESHGLGSVEFRILKCGDANQAIHQGRRQIFLFDVDKIGHHHTDCRWQWICNSSVFPLARWAPKPGNLVPSFFGKAQVHSDRVSARRYFLNRASQHTRRDSLNQLQEFPLVAMRLEEFVQEHAVALLSGSFLEWQSY
jgi:hypothetical protein